MGYGEKETLKKEIILFFYFLKLILTIPYDYVIAHDIYNHYCTCCSVIIFVYSSAI